MSDNQAVVISSQGTSMLAQYGTRREVAELAERIQITKEVFDGQTKETRKLHKSEAIELAQAALMSGLNVWAGDVYPMVDYKGNFKIGYGRGALLKGVKQQIAKNGGGNFIPTVRPMTGEEIAEYGAPPDVTCAMIAKITDTPSMRAYTELVSSMQKAGASWEEIKDISCSPFTIGVGWTTKGERGIENSAMPLAQRAAKRALADAIRKRYTLPDNAVVSSDDLDVATELPTQYTGQMREETKIINGDKSETK